MNFYFKLLKSIKNGINFIEGMTNKKSKNDNDMSYQDITLKCADCNCEFTFTTGEQEFFASKGLVNTPKRCSDCRSAKKTQRRAQRKMYDATCSDCGCETQVPFKPIEEKPVFCKECFAKARV